MAQASTSDAGKHAAPAASPAPAPTATEIVHRPDPGLARGVWEAQPWVFYVLAGAMLLGGGLYAAGRLGLLRRSKKENK